MNSQLIAHNQLSGEEIDAVANCRVHFHGNKWRHCAREWCSKSEDRTTLSMRIAHCPVLINGSWSGGRPADCLSVCLSASLGLSLQVGVYDVYMTNWTLPLSGRVRTCCPRRPSRVEEVRAITLDQTCQTLDDASITRRPTRTGTERGANIVILQVAETVADLA